MRGRKGSRAETAELMQEYQRAESEKARLLLKIGECRKSGAPDAEIADAIGCYIDELKRQAGAAELIKLVDDPRARGILFCSYIQGYSDTRMSEEIFLCKRHAQRKKAEALASLEEKTKKDCVRAQKGI